MLELHIEAEAQRFGHGVGTYIEAISQRVVEIFANFRIPSGVGCLCPEVIGGSIDSQVADIEF
jgi:hypothetical protein